MENDTQQDKPQQQDNQATAGGQGSGDSTTVGDITNAKGVAIGRGSTVVINETERKPLLLLAAALLVAAVVIAVALYAVNRTPPGIPPLELVDRVAIAEVAGDLLQDVVVLDETAWFATRKGLLWKDEDLRDHDRIWPDKWITAVAKDGRDEGRIWFGTDGGELGRVDLPGVPELVDNDQIGVVTAIAIDKTGSAWVAGTELGIGRYSPDGAAIAEPIPLPKGGTVISMDFLNKAGEPLLWAITLPGVYWWKDGAWEAKFDREERMPDAVYYNVTVDEAGGTWFAHSEGLTHVSFPGQISRSEIKTKSCSASEGQIPSGPVRDLAVHNGWMWLVTEHGIARKEIDLTGESDPCSGWQMYIPPENDDTLLDAAWKMDVRDDSCKVWLAAASDVDAYRIEFDRC